MRSPLFYSVSVACLGLCTTDVITTCMFPPGMLYHHALVSVQELSIQGPSPRQWHDLPFLFIYAYRTQLGH